VLSVGGSFPSVFFFDARLRNHQMIAPTITAPARMPKAIQPHWVLLSASLFLEATAAPAAAAPAGVTPEVVVAAEVVVAGGGAVTVVGDACVCVSVTDNVVAGAVCVTVVVGPVCVTVGEVVVTVAMAVGVFSVCVGVVSVCVVRVGVEIVGVVRVADVRVVPALVLPPPHDVRATAASRPRAAAAASLKATNPRDVHWRDRPAVR
jgi:hypothetical protein